MGPTRCELVHKSRPTMPLHQHHSECSSIPDPTPHSLVSVLAMTEFVGEIVSFSLKFAASLLNPEFSTNIDNQIQLIKGPNQRPPTLNNC